MAGIDWIKGRTVGPEVGPIVEETDSAIGVSVGSKLSSIGSVGFTDGWRVGLPAREFVGNVVTSFIVGDEDAGGLTVISTGTDAGGLVVGFEEGRRVGPLVSSFADGLSVGADDTGCFDGGRVGSTGTGVGRLVVGFADGRSVGLLVPTTAGKPLVGDAEAGLPVAGGGPALDGIVVCLVGADEGVG